MGTRDEVVSEKRLFALVKTFARRRLLVVGDLMLDRYIWGDVERISPEAPVPVIRVRDERLRLGGAANVVQNIIGLGGNVRVCSVIGSDRAGQWVSRQLRSIGASTQGIFTDRRIATTEKSRVIAMPRNQQLVRLDRENRKVTSKATLERLLKYIEVAAVDCDGIVVSDYGKGTIQQAVLEKVISVAGKYRLFTVIDPKKRNFDAYHNVKLVTPNREEASEAVGFEISDKRSLLKAGKLLLEKWRAEAVLITLGSDGMMLIRPEGGVHFPTAAQEVFDVTGAGDTVVATCALALSARSTYEEAVSLGNVAAGSVVGEVGTIAITIVKLKEAIKEKYQT